jgi:hypothetical protein
MTGIKDDIGKPRMDLLEPDFLRDIASVMGYGASKYDDHNWKGGMPFGRIYGALQRHLNAYWSGEELDSESGLPHLAHAGCCLQFLHWMDAYRPDLDDRYNTKQMRIFKGEVGWPQGYKNPDLDK